MFKKVVSNSCRNLLSDKWNHEGRNELLFHLDKIHTTDLGANPDLSQCFDTLMPLMDLIVTLQELE